MIPPSDETRPGSSQTSAKPTLEELLRVKRAERPDAAFWTDFERGLAQKQLAAIVEPKPWWLGLALLSRRASALRLPVSAAAAALFAVMVVRTESPLLVTQGAVEFGPGATVKTAKQSPADGVVVTAAKKTGSAVSSIQSEARKARDDEGRVADSSVVAQPTGVVAAGPIEGAEPVVAVAEAKSGDEAQEVVSTVASLLDLSPKSSPQVQTASQITIAQNLAAVTAEEPELVASITPSVSFAEEASTAGAVLSEMAANSRQARLLAMAETPELGDASAGLAQVRERMVHRLAYDESNYASSGRLGYGADRLSLRF